LQTLLQTSPISFLDKNESFSDGESTINNILEILFTYLQTIYVKIANNSNNQKFYSIAKKGISLFVKYYLISFDDYKSKKLFNLVATINIDLFLELISEIIRRSSSYIQNIFLDRTTAYLLSFKAVEKDIGGGPNTVECPLKQVKTMFLAVNKEGPESLGTNGFTLIANFKNLLYNTLNSRRVVLRAISDRLKVSHSQTKDQFYNKLIAIIERDTGGLCKNFLSVASLLKDLKDMCNVNTNSEYVNISFRLFTIFDIVFYLAHLRRKYDDFRQIEETNFSQIHNDDSEFFSGVTNGFNLVSANNHFELTIEKFLAEKFFLLEHYIKDNDGLDQKIRTKILISFFSDKKFSPLIDFSMKKNLIS
jgi:hypothetical protein